LGLWTALSRNHAQTEGRSIDPRLRGRTYQIPFARVWDTAVTLAEAMPRWRIVSTDEDRGIIQAEAQTRVFKFTDDVTIRLRLDDNALTRVDMLSASRRGFGDLGTNARRIARFLERLDERLGFR
jgi:uncharacterized protein (DUF1499 family)